jgi:hypothetical protein
VSDSATFCDGTITLGFNSSLLFTTNVAPPAREPVNTEVPEDPAVPEQVTLPDSMAVSTKTGARPFGCVLNTDDRAMNRDFKKTLEAENPCEAEKSSDGEKSTEVEKSLEPANTRLGRMACVTATACVGLKAIVFSGVRDAENPPEPVNCRVGPLFADASNSADGVGVGVWLIVGLGVLLRVGLGVWLIVGLGVLLLVGLGVWVRVGLGVLLRDGDGWHA